MHGSGVAPGRKLAISEYNFGGEDLRATIAEAEALGCYADANVYLATIWGGNPFRFAGIRLYTNYGGEGGSADAADIKRR